jgi:hypothetical protein
VAQSANCEEERYIVLERLIVVAGEKLEGDRTVVGCYSFPNFGVNVAVQGSAQAATGIRLVARVEWMTGAHGDRPA